MVKIILVICILVTIGNSKSKNNCIKCHIIQKIPSEFIYRRYLMRYSDKNIIKNKIIKYLNEPIKENSIMPKQFFLKFPMKNKSDISQIILKKNVDEYIELFDIKNRLSLDKER